MAADTVHSRSGAATPSQAPLRFEPFRWRHPAVNSARIDGAVVAGFAERAQDIANGVRAVLEVLEWDVLEHAVPPRDPLQGAATAHMVFAPHTVGELRRLAIASLGLMGADAERTLEWMYAAHTEEGRQEQQRDDAAARRHPDSAAAG